MTNKIRSKKEVNVIQDLQKTLICSLRELTCKGVSMGMQSASRAGKSCSGGSALTIMLNAIHQTKQNKDNIKDLIGNTTQNTVTFQTIELSANTT